MSPSPVKQNGVEGSKHSPAAPVPGTPKDRPMSKDPRRANSQSQTDGPEQSQSDNLAQLLHEFAIQTSIITNLEAERDRLRKKVQRETEERTKMEPREFRYPSVLSTTWNSSEQLAATEQELHNHLKMQDQLARKLAGILLPPDTLESVKTSLSELKARVTSLETQDQGWEKSKLSHIESTLRNLQIKISSLETGRKSISKLATLEGQLRGNQSTTSKVQSRVTTLETQIGQVESIVTSHDNVVDSMKRSIDVLGDTFEMISKHEEERRQLGGTVASNHETISKQLDGLKRDVILQKSFVIDTVAKARSELEGKIPSAAQTSAPATSSPSLEDFNTVQSNLQNLFDQFESFRDTLSKKDKHEEERRQLGGTVASNHEAISKQLDELNRDVILQEAFVVDTVAKARSQLEAARASAPATSSPSFEDFNTLQSNLQNLFNQFESLRDTLSEKDGIVAEEIEKAQSLTRQQAERNESITQDVTSLLKAVDDLKQQSASLATQNTAPVPANPQFSETQQQIQEVRAYCDSVQAKSNGHDEVIRSLRIGLQSLQTRCNNMTSEPIVRQMLAAMENVYPFASTAQKEIENLRHVLSNSVMTTIRTLTSKVDASERAQQQAIQERDVSIKEMSLERDRLSDHIERLSTRMESLEKAALAGDEKQKKDATDHQVAPGNDRQAAEIMDVKSRQDEMEKVFAKKLADTLSQMEQLRKEHEVVRNENASMLSLIRKFSVDAVEEGRMRFQQDASIREQEEERRNCLQQFQARQNGDHSSREPSQSHASPHESDGSPTDDYSPIGARASYGPKRLGRHLATSPPSLSFKRQKRGGGSLHHRVSRDY